MMKALLHRPEPAFPFSGCQLFEHRHGIAFFPVLLGSIMDRGSRITHAWTPFPLEGKPPDSAAASCREISAIDSFPTN